MKLLLKLSLREAIRQSAESDAAILN